MTPATASIPHTLSPYHSKYYAYELTRRCPPDSEDRLTIALLDAGGLNPHQIDAALSARAKVSSLIPPTNARLDRKESTT